MWWLFLILLPAVMAAHCELPQISEQPFGGHTQECFHQKLLSYDLCIHFFLQSSCAAMSFEDMLCSLHARPYTLRLSGGPVLAYTRPTCDFVSARQRLAQCLRHPSIPDISFLPELAIVVSITRDFLESREGLVKSVTSNMQCYADVHNYKFVSNYNMSFYLL